MKGAIRAVAWVGLLALSGSPAHGSESAVPGDILSHWNRLLDEQQRSSCTAPVYMLRQENLDDEDVVVQLVRVLRHENPVLRRSAAAALGDTQSYSGMVVPALVACLRDTDERVREHATLALAKIGAPAVPHLVKLLREVSVSLDSSRRIGKDGQTDVRLSDLATIALARTHAPVVQPLVDEFRRLVQAEANAPRRTPSESEDEWGEERFSLGYFYWSAVFIIGQNQGDAVADLIPLLSDEIPQVRSLALDALGSIGAGATPAIASIESLIAKQGRTSAESVVHTLLDIGASALPTLANILKTSEDSKLRIEVASGLRRIGPEATAHLAQSLEGDPKPEVRAMAATALGEIHMETNAGVAVLALGRALRDQDLGVRKKAAYGLRLVLNHPTPEARIIFPDLIEALQAPNAEVRASVASVLATIGSEAAAAVPMLLRSLASPPQPDPDDFLFGDHRASLIQALGEIGNPDPQVVSALSGVLRDPSLARLHTEAAVALGNLGKPAEPSVPLLMVLVKGLGPYDSRKVLQALTRLSPMAVVDLVQDSRAGMDLRSDACWLLAKTPELARQALPSVEALLATRELRSCAAILLAQSSGISDRVVDVVREVLVHSEKGDVPVDELAELGEISVDLIDQALQTGVVADTSRLVTILEEIAERKPDLIDPKITPLLIRLLEDTDAETREAAAELIGKLRPAGAAGPATLALVKLLQDELKPNVDLRGWREVGPGAFHRFAIPVIAALQALQQLDSLAEPAVPYLSSILDFPDPTIRQMALSALGQIGPASVSVREKIIAKLCDPESNVRSEAAKALSGLGLEIDELGANFSAVSIDGYLHTFMSEAYDELADLLRSSPLMSGPGVPGLPPFPWPPPRFTHVAVFGRDLPRELLGTDDTELQTVYKRLYGVLQTTDPGFESGLFSVPGGFAMLAKLERINADGAPYPGRYRWLEGKVPPLSLQDYIGRLFFEEKGYFRVVAFVITDQQNFGSSNRPLPDIAAGGTDLPPEIARARFQGRTCYALVYSFERRRGGQPQPYKSLSALIHLRQAGVLNALGAH